MNLLTIRTKRPQSKLCKISWTFVLSPIYYHQVSLFSWFPPSCPLFMYFLSRFFTKLSKNNFFQLYNRKRIFFQLPLSGRIDLSQCGIFYFKALCRKRSQFSQAVRYSSMLVSMLRSSIVCYFPWKYVGSFT